MWLRMTEDRHTNSSQINRLASCNPIPLFFILRVEFPFKFVLPALSIDSIYICFHLNLLKRNKITFLWLSKILSTIDILWCFFIISKINQCFGYKRKYAKETSSKINITTLYGDLSGMVCMDCHLNCIQYMYIFYYLI